MYIHFEKKLLYVAVPKTGSRSIHHLLINSYKNKLTERNWTKENYHLPYREIKKKYQVESFFKFAFTRNPFDRMISTFLDFTDNKDDHREFANDFFKEFKNFREFVLNFSNTKWAKEIHMRPSTWYLEDEKGNIDFDFMGRYENYNSDLNYMIDTVDCKNKDRIKIPTLGKTIRSKPNDEYYTDKKMVKCVMDYYKSDFEKSKKNDNGLFTPAFYEN